MKKWLISLILISLLVTSTVMVAVAQEPTVEPTEEPTAEPTEEPTAEPTEEPTAEPTEEPTAEPTEEPTAEPTEEPTVEPTEEPTAEPTEEPTEEPTVEPTVEPTLAPSEIGDQAIGSLTTVVHVQNTSSSDNGIALTWYDANGSESGTATSDTLAGNGCGQYQYPGAGPFRGSATISSAEPVVAEVRITNDPTSAMGVSAGYVGTETGSTGRIFLPSVHNSVWQTLVAVMNVGSASTSVRITVDGGATINDTIEANASRYYDSAALGLPSGGYGSAIVESIGGEPLYVVVKEEVGSTNTVVAYEGIPESAAATALYVPMYNRNSTGSSANGWVGNLMIQNTAGTQATARVTWYDTSGATAEVQDFSINSGESVYVAGVLYPTNRNSWAGSATIESVGAGSQPLVAMTAFLWANGGVRGHYGWFKCPSSGTQTAYGPVVTKNYSSQLDGNNVNILVQNVGSGPADITLTYYNTNGSVKATKLVNDLAVGSNDYTAIQTLGGISEDTWEGCVVITADQNIAAVGLGQGLGGKVGMSGWPRDTANIYNFVNR